LDSGNRMAGITGPVTASYGYDYQGRRRVKTVGGVTTKYLYDGLNLIGELGASPADYLFGPGLDEPIAMNRGGQVSYYETDALGSINAFTNASGAVQNTYLYDAWGQTRNQTGSLANPFTYTSREAGEAGALFYRARYLNPGAGRFLAEDPIRGGDGPSLFSYVGSSPISFVDPTGLERVTCCTWELADAKRSADRRLELLKTTGTASEPGSPATVGAKTYCDVYTIADAAGREVDFAYGHTAPFDRFNDAPCPFLCRQMHEKRHRSDCGRYRRRYKEWTEAQREIPGYMEELRCLDRALTQGFLDVRNRNVY
ncbi:MAG: RHS repeat-associated core domain-containing protein, partial [Acidobacteriota bacterium]|nr:RHS repeat-associated core domain-containing protein [Acidobacteriota bacterium]